MARRRAAKETQFSSTIRFVQGYRYLDRCGLALISLENKLGEGWIPGEVSPQGGNLANYVLGLRAVFSSEQLTVIQEDFVSYEHFQDGVCTIFEVLRGTFEINRILTPSMQVTLQTGFDDVDEAEAYIRELRLMSPSRSVLDAMGGDTEALSFVLCTAEEVKGSRRRRRLEVKGIKQVRQAPFDQRLVQRLPHIPLSHQSAIADLLKIRRRHPERHPFAAQFAIENSLEGEFSASTFDLPQFMDDTWNWAKELQSLIKTPV